MESIIDRMKQPTPKFFRALRNIGIAVAAASGVLIASPVAIPAVIIRVAGYLALAASVMSAVSQTAVATDENKPHA